MKRAHGLGLGVVAVGGAVALAISLRGGAAHEAHATARVPTVALPVSAAPAPVLEIGVEHQYRAHLAQAVTLGKEAPFVITADGTWSVAYAGPNPDGTQLFRAQLRDAKPKVIRDGVDTTAALGDTLGTAFYFATSNDGAITSLSFDRATADVTKSALSTLATTFTVSHVRGNETWEATERDTIGSYQARYARTSAGVRRERLAYRQVATAIAAAVVTTGTDITYRAEDRWLRSLRGHEVTRMGTDQLAVVVDATFSLDFVGTARIAPGSRDELVTVAVGAKLVQGTTEAEDREMVDGASLADLLAGLALLTDDHAKGYQFLRIAALMRLEPETVRAAQQLVVDKSPHAGTLIGALGEANTPVAQRALGELLAMPALGDEPRTQAAAAMGLVQTPTPEAARALADAAQGSGDVAATATLAQGNLALRMGDDDPAAAAAQVDALLARYRRATDDAERALVIRALGNTGDPRILEAVGHALASTTLDLRIAATEALRLVPGAAADKLLLGRFGDPEGIVRGAAVFATVERDLGPFAQALSRAAQQDPDLAVRRAVVDLAAARLADHPALRQLVEHVAKAEADPELREVARRLLAG